MGLTYKQFKTELFTDSFWDDFREKNPLYIHLSNIELVSKWKDLVDAMCEILINETDGLRLYKGGGDLHLRLINKPKDTYKDYTDKVHMNWHTDRKPGKVIWSINSARKVHQRLTFFGMMFKSNVKSYAYYGFKKNGTNIKDMTVKTKFIK